ncbi:hypothetical protein [Francisella adeliensis]|uniref:Uncharacterized protein n=1 Tax=Francisella adeliensis TaxID=2007306 RepID=A0A2Z4XYD3_9GAMM|nr:hypothetical protein [Francisella adeliensis]AXA33435.1 hypothetical protein CDH04_02955 [Francisella adeliensis]MBK2085454.1 hypothetical protein [Francisella adeliensis]MBK2097184.1 hypothetical protein [Francisella adeliensis]QIW11663.1 hypothetical protein FZC43_02955 [Francisella adeliensis]QIW13538.1 hypothetical protein FZC44_02955 [Francisella adeliensis]
MKKTLLSIIAFMILLQSGYSFVWSYTGQFQDMAKNYADKKYGEDFKVEESYDNGLTVVLGDYKSTSWFTSKKLYECRVFLSRVVGTQGINANPTVPNIADEFNVNSDTCGENILMPKVKKYIETNFISDYYDLSKIDFSIKIKYNNPKYPYGNERLFYDTDTYEIFNQDNNWKLSAKDWLAKYKNKIQIDRVSINIYEQPENAENIAKAMKFGYELDNYLRSLTTSHKINGIYIYMTDLTSQEMQKKGGLVGKINFSKEHLNDSRFNFYFSLNDSFNINISPQKYYKYISITNSNRSNMSFIKETKYYQPVKKILESKLSK